LRNPAGILPVHTDKPVKKPNFGFVAKKANVSKTTQSIIFPYGQYYNDLWGFVKHLTPMVQ
jgi:hypothetical protein